MKEREIRKIYIKWRRKYGVLECNESTPYFRLHEMYIVSNFWPTQETVREICKVFWSRASARDQKTLQISSTVSRVDQKFEIEFPENFLFD